MVASRSVTVSDANLTPDARASIVSSAKMYLGMSLAVVHLRETGAIPKSISDMITELSKTLGEPPVPALRHQPRPALPSHFVETPPLKVPAKRDYTPRNDREVIVQAGDHVIVFARIGFEAIAYNIRNKTAGRMSEDLLDMSRQEEWKGDKLYLATSKGRPTDNYPVSWEKGDYIRVWEREDDSHSRASGVCFNLASGQIGRFNTNASFSLKLMD